MNKTEINQLLASVISLENEIEDLQKISRGKSFQAKAAKDFLPLRRKELKQLYVKVRTQTSTKYTHKEIAHMFDHCGGDKNGADS